MRYGELVAVYQKLESTTKRLEKTFYIAELLKKTDIEHIQPVVLLLQGRIYPQSSEQETGVSSRLVLKALNIATGIPMHEIEEMWKKAGDLGIVAEKITAVKKQSTLFTADLTVKKIFENLRKLSETGGQGAVDRKVKLIAELLTSANPVEARYITRTVLEEMRFGVGEGSVRDALVWAFFGDKLNIKYDKEKNDIPFKDEERTKYNNYVDFVQEAYDITNDFSEVARIARQKGLLGLTDVRLETGRPLKVMLYQKEENLADAFERVGVPAAFEYKYDGFRLQIHCSNGEIKLFTRRLENVTKQFPDVVEIVKENIKSENYILDSEIIGIDPETKKWLAFQSISQRIKRKYDIYQIVKDVPVMINIFDAVQVNGKNLIKIPFKERREEIRKIVNEVPEKINLAKQIITSDISEAKKFYKESLSLGNEGIMAKNLEAPYKPGSRVGYGVKVKPVMETLDLVIVGADWGEGKRAQWLSSFTIACVDADGNFLEIGKVGTGIKEKPEEGVSFEFLTNTLKPLILEEKGKNIKVKPSVVIEINYEEIQKSPTYNSGYDLRFPRLITIREDRAPEEISTLEQVEELYFRQRGK
ncbi:ATP-dependent DNA ligase [Candidatus Woesearchaeota archaeon]|nr:ATP-dependent DNA ligase [Candidatus Woesearchaeota archaeon]